MIWAEDELTWPTDRFGSIGITGGIVASSWKRINLLIRYETFYDVDNDKSNEKQCVVVTSSGSVLTV